MAQLAPSERFRRLSTRIVSANGSIMIERGTRDDDYGIRDETVPELLRLHG